MKLCDYGCGKEAKYPLKNGKWCCSKSQNSCPILREKNSSSKIGKCISEKTKKKISKSNSGKNNGMFGKHPSQKSIERRAKKLRTPFEKIVDFVRRENYIILSKKKDFKNQFSYLKFVCPEGHKFEKRWDGFLTGYRCPICAGNNFGRRIKNYMLNGGAEKRRQKMLNGGAVYIRSFIKNPSKPQVKLFNLVKEIYPEAVLEYSCLNYSIDIAIPNLYIAVEYDGSYWHQDQEADNKRQKEIENKGWIFLRYRDYIPTKEELKRNIFLKIVN